MKKTFNSFGFGFGGRSVPLAFAIVELCPGSRVLAQEAESPVSADEATAIAIDAYIYV